MPEFDAAIRILECRKLTGDVWYIYAAGPSTATKPTTGICSGSVRGLSVSKTLLHRGGMFCFAYRAAAGI